MPANKFQARLDLIDDLRNRSGSITYADACDRNAIEFPDHIALVDPGSRFGWAEVKRISDRLALALFEKDVMRPDTVLVHLPNVADQFLIRLACEKAGVRVVLTSTWFREAELLPIIERTRPRVAFVSAASACAGDYDNLRSALDGRGVPLAYVTVGDGAVPWAETFSSMLEDAPSYECDGLLGRTRFRWSDRFYLPTTSGSTSAPKISDMIFGQRIWLSLAHSAGVSLRVGETIAALAPITSGTSDSLVNHAAPYYVAKVVLDPKFDAPSTCALLADEEAHVAIVVPTMLARMLATGAIDRLRNAPFRCFVTYASAISYELGVAIEERGGCRVVQCYGTMDYGGITMSTYDDSRDVRIRTVGKPLPGNDIRILAEDGSETPPGVPGEVVIRPGRYSTGGYFRDPQRTQAAWSEEYYRLGDIGVFDEEGNITLVGRSKDLIIRGGQNIVPAEIEELLATHPKVVDATVLGIPDEELGERVCACVILRDGEALGLDELRAHFDSLGVARFKCPDRIETMDEFPMAMSGMKVDRRRLLEIVGPP